MIKSYFTPDTENNLACFGCSVANVLIELGDCDTARLAYEKAKSHSLSNGNGEFIDLFAGIVFRDLTEGKYQGVLSLFQTVPIDDTLRRVFGERAEEVKRLLSQEQEKGLLKFVNHPRELRVHSPSLLCP